MWSSPGQLVRNCWLRRIASLRLVVLNHQRADVIAAGRVVINVGAVAQRELLGAPAPAVHGLRDRMDASDEIWH